MAKTTVGVNKRELMVEIQIILLGDRGTCVKCHSATSPLK